MDPRARKQLVVSASALAGLALVVLLMRGQGPSTHSGQQGSASTSSSAKPPQLPVATPPPPRDLAALRARFVGSATCAPCHAEQAAAYAKSHHANALAVATPERVHAKFDGATFTTPLGGSTRFGQNAGKLEVSSPDAAGATKTFSVAYVAGVSPLEQYVVSTESGKLQTLGVSWDTRPKAQGGERFFHLYGPKGIAHDDSLFFTRPAQNWNHVCADCHSTLVERRYDAGADRFDTRWAELSVGCEACHGPGAEHVDAAKAHPANGPGAYKKTFTVGLEPSEPWAPSPSGSPTARAKDTVEIEVCAPCHSRREPLREGFVAGDPFLDAFEPELLRAGAYHADGQVEGEVYEWGSFLQSKMYASGVRCSDCHEPHSGGLRAQGNALCTRCHEPTRFDAASHTHHTGAKAPACVDCHMPPSTYMQIDERRDHSIRIPRPDLSLDFGTPNACTGCHAKKDARWALAELAKWFPGATRPHHFGEAFGLDQKGKLDAPRALAALAREATAPAIARATALERLGQYQTSGALGALKEAMSNPDPLVVYGAVRGANELPLLQRAPLLTAVMEHPRRAVRIEVGKGLVEMPLDQVTPEMRAALERRFQEVEESFVVGASRPETHVERSVFELKRGRPGEAEAELRTALRLAPCLVEAHLNLADLARDREDEPGSERAIRAALGCAPNSAAAHHALGLWLIRAEKKTEAAASLRKAVELAPNESRYSYVLAVLVQESGDVEGAVKILETSLEKHGNDRDLLQTLAEYLRKLDQKELAAEVEARLNALMRD
ncbi:MAG TPA: cytochrome c3 family protein [Polyangiaceae bacterium]|nr:cytochrome c3 family protein [Polyangiaceae bacterium]